MSLRDYGLKPNIQRPEDSQLVDEAIAAGYTELGRGWEAGRIGAEVNSLAAQEAALRAAGADGTAAPIREQITGLQRKASIYAPSVNQVEDVTRRNWGSYAAGQVGQGAASMLDPMAAAGAIGAVGRVGQFVPGVGGALARVAQLAAPLAAYGINQNQLTGEAYNSMVADPVLMQRTTPQERYQNANLYGAGAAVLDTIVPAGAAAKLTGAGMRAGTKGVAPWGLRTLGDMGMEGATETAQQFGQQQTLGYMNPDRDTSGDRSDLINSFVGGAIGAGPIVGASNLADAGYRRGGEAYDQAVQAIGEAGAAAGKKISPLATAAKTLFGRAKDSVEEIDLDTGRALVKDLADRTKDVVSRTKQAVDDQELFSPLTELPKGMSVDSPEFIKMVEERDAKRAARFTDLLAQRTDDPQAQELSQRMQSANPVERAQAIDDAGDYLNNASTMTRVSRQAGRAATRMAEFGKRAASKTAGLAKNVAAGVNEGRKLNAQEAGGEQSDPSFEQWIKARDEMRAGLRDTQLPRQPNAGDQAGAEFDARTESFKRAAQFADLSAAYMADKAERRWRNRLNTKSLARELGYELTALDAGFDYKAPGQGAVRAVAGEGKGRFAKRGAAARAGETPGTLPRARLNYLAQKLNDLYGEESPAVLNEVRSILERQGKPLTKLDYVAQELQMQREDPRGALRKQAAERETLGNDLVSLIQPETEMKLLSQGVNLRTDSGRDELVRLVQTFVNDSGDNAAAQRKQLDSVFGRETVDAMLERVEPEEFARPELVADMPDGSTLLDDNGNEIEGKEFQQRLAEKAMGRQSADAEYTFAGRGSKRYGKSGLVNARGEFDKDVKFLSKDKIVGVYNKNGDPVRSETTGEDLRVPQTEAALRIENESIGPEQGASLISARQLMKELGVPDEAIYERAGVTKYMLSRSVTGPGMSPEQTKAASEMRGKIKELVDKFKDGNFVVRTERIAPRDPAAMDPQEFRALVRNGRKNADAARGSAKNGDEAAQNAELDRRNVLFFTDAEGNEVPVLAGKLAAYGMKRLSEAGQQNGSEGTQQEFLSGLLEGITAVLAQEGMGKEMPYRVAADGSVESFADGVPSSLRVRDGKTHADVKAELEARKRAGQKARNREENKLRGKLWAESDQLVKDGKLPEALQESWVEARLVETKQEEQLGKAATRVAAEQDKELGDEIAEDPEAALNDEAANLKKFSQQLERGASVQGAPDVDRSPPSEAGYLSATDREPYNARKIRAVKQAREMAAKMSDEAVYAGAKAVLDREAAQRADGQPVKVRSPADEALVQLAYERAGAARQARSMAPKVEPAPEVAGTAGPKSQSAQAGVRSLSAQSAERLDPSRVATAKEIADARAYVKRVLGDRIKAVFRDIEIELPDGRKVKVSGEYIDAEKLIVLSTTAGPGVLHTAYHEAMHALWAALGKQPEVREVLRNVTSNPAVLNRIRALLDKSPMAQAQLGSAEERVAYAYQFWAAGQLNVGRAASTFFDKVRRALRTIFGMVRAEDRAAEIFEAFHKGAFADPSAAGVALEKIMSRGTWVEKTRKKFDKQIQWLMKGAAPSHTILMTSESETAQRIGRMFYTAPGDETAGKDAEGYLNASRRVTAQYLNLAADVLEGLDDKDMIAVEKYLQAETELTAIPYGPHREAVSRVRKLLNRYYGYAKDSGVKIGYAGDKYYPRVWDVQKLIEGKEEFVQMLLTKYSKILDDFKTTGKYADAQTAAEAMHSMLVDRGGVEDKLDAQRDDGVLSPFFEAQNNRVFHWLKGKDAEPFLEKDLIGQLTRYFRQGVRSAEYTTRFGDRGQELSKALDDRTEQYTVPEYEEMVAKDKLPRGVLSTTRGFDPETKQQVVTLRIAGDIKADLMEKAPDGDKAWVNRRLEAIQQATGAMEGSLGKDIDPKWRKTSSWLMVYQNLRLLPLSLFASVVDPLGLVARGATLKQAGDAFLRGMGQVVSDWKRSFSGDLTRQAKDPLERLAEIIGVVDSQHYLDSLGSAYASEYLDEGARKTNNWLFNLNGMESWNRSMRVSATGAAIGFIEQHAAGVDKTHSARWVRELGLDPKNVPLKDGKLVTTLQELAALRGLDLDKDNERKQAEAEIGKVHAAITRWVEGAVLTPNAAQRPSWSSDPHWAWMFHLKQFTYSFHQTILRRAAREANYGNLGPLGAFLWYVPVMIATDITKGLIQGGGSLPDYMKAYNVGDWMMHGIQRAGLTGIGQIGIDAGQDPFSILGPSVEQVTDAIREPVEKTAVKALPFMPVYKEALL